MPAKPCCFRLAGANVGTFSDSPNFRKLFLRFSCIFSALTLHAPAHDPKKRNDYQPKSTEPLHTAQNLPPDSKQGPLFTENSENAFLSRPENGLDRRAESTKSDEKISGIAPFYIKDALRYSGIETKKHRRTANRTKRKRSGPTRDTKRSYRPEETSLLESASRNTTEKPQTDKTT